LRARGPPAAAAAAIDDLDLEAIVELAARAGAWIHVDGAFGLWAAASPALTHLVAGYERADSWATDGHKWLNVPFDCGIALCRHGEDHVGAFGARASYLIQGGDSAPYDPFMWTPEFSRRARSLPVYAVLRSLGRSGVAELVDRLCSCAERFAERFQERPGVDVLARGLNQVLVRFDAPDEADAAAGDARTRAIVVAVQREGTCWMSGTDWHGQAAMRISVSNWSTTEADVDRSVESIARVLAELG